MKPFIDISSSSFTANEFSKTARISSRLKWLKGEKTYVSGTSYFLVSRELYLDDKYRYCSPNVHSSTTGRGWKPVRIL
jgi:hypothetical protein